MKLVASRLSGATRVIRVEAIKVRNWLLKFGCASEELISVLAYMSDWLNPPPPIHLPCADGITVGGPQ